MTDPVAPPVLPKLSPKDKARIHAYWDDKNNDYVRVLMDHDGVRKLKDRALPRSVRQNDMETDVNVRDNPLLIRAIEEIRDGYFRIEKAMRILDRKERRALALRPLSPDDPIMLEVAAIDRLAIIHNHESLMFRLMKQDYGFTPEEKAEILAGIPVEKQVGMGKPLELKDAYLILGKTIRRSVDCFKELYPKTPSSAVNIPEKTVAPKDYTPSGKFIL